MRGLQIALAVAGAIALPGAASPRAQSTTAPTSLVEGPGSDEARTACLGCHEADLIATQRLSTVGWEREVAKMERWGAKIPPADRQKLVEYLSGNFGVRPVASHSDPAAIASGQRVYEQACRTCHADDLSEQQRLSESGWTRTVRKMVQWGARVSPASEQSLVAYLVSRWGPLRTDFI
jgi:hypothetical protein